MESDIIKRLKERLNTLTIETKKPKKKGECRWDDEYIETPILDLIIDRTLEDAYKYPSIDKLLKIEALIKDQDIPDKEG